MKKPKKSEQPKSIPTNDLLSTGSTLLNIACSGNPRGAIPKGKYALLVGASAAGKTFQSMTLFAEACKNSGFDEYTFVYDNVEDGMLMDVAMLFGKETELRVKAPEYDNEGEPVYSSTIEEFYYHVDDFVKVGKPFIYVLDSMDGLSSEAEEEHFEKSKKASRKGKDGPGSYGDGKAKKNSSHLRKLMKGLRSTGSILVIICQERDVLNAGPFQDNRTRSGGRALRFYATLEMWLSQAGQIKTSAKIRGKKRLLGNKVLVKLKKNRVTGKLPHVMFPIYPTYGIDDIQSCIDYLIDEKHWKKKSQKIAAGEFGLVGRKQLIRECENGKMKLLRKEVLECWRAVEEESKVLERKPRYV